MPGGTRGAVAAGCAGVAPGWLGGAPCDPALCGATPCGRPWNTGVPEGAKAGSDPAGEAGLVTSNHRSAFGPPRPGALGTPSFRIRCSPSEPILLRSTRSATLDVAAGGAGAVVNCPVGAGTGTGMDGDSGRAC